MLKVALPELPQIAVPEVISSTVPEVRDSAPQSHTERELLLQILHETNGLVSGPRGAAAKLGVSRSTLLSRMLALVISPKEVKRASRLHRLNDALSSGRKNS